MPTWPSARSWWSAVKDVVWNRWFGGIQTVLAAFAFIRDPVKDSWPGSRVVKWLESLPRMSTVDWAIAATVVLFFFYIKALAEAEERRRPRLKILVDPVYTEIHGTNVLHLCRVAVVNTGEEEARELCLVVYDSSPQNAAVHPSLRLQVTGGSANKSATHVRPRATVRFDLIQELWPARNDFEICYSVAPIVRFLGVGSYCITLRAESSQGCSELFDVIVSGINGALSTCQPSDLIVAAR